MIPDCYDPVIQEERRQAAWDKYAASLSECVICGHRLHPGDRFHTARCKTVCTFCLDELAENCDMVEVA